MVTLVGVAVFGAVHEAEVVADVVRELGLQAGAEHFEAVLAGRGFERLDEQCGRGVAKDEMAVSVAEVQMPGADLRTDHQCRPRRATAHRIDRRLHTEGGRCAGDVHVVAVTAGTEKMLKLDRHRRIRPLHVRAGDEHGIDIGSRAAGVLQRLLHPGEALVEHLPAEKILDLFVLLFGFAAAPLVFREFLHGLGR
mgnify:CR=1 FL=1